MGEQRARQSPIEEQGVRKTGLHKGARNETDRVPQRKEQALLNETFCPEETGTLLFQFFSFISSLP